MHDKLAPRENNISTSGFALKTNYDTDKSDLEKKISYAGKKIPDTSEPIKKINYNAKVSKIENNIPAR